MEYELIFRDKDFYFIHYRSTSYYRTLSACIGSLYGSWGSCWTALTAPHSGRVPHKAVP